MDKVQNLDLPGEGCNRRALIPSAPRDPLVFLAQLPAKVLQTRQVQAEFSAIAIVRDRIEQVFEQIALCRAEQVGAFFVTNIHQLAGRTWHSWGMGITGNQKKQGDAASVRQRCPEYRQPGSSAGFLNHHRAPGVTCG
ncbi:MAG: hypothetical protein ACNA7E_03395 [Wenzhouxiangellaceae bacterium]